MEMAIRLGMSFKSQASERGWLLTTIMFICLFVGVMCMGVGALVAYIAVARGNVPVQQPAAMFSAGLLLIVATHSMWHYERWGRNIAVAVTFCMGWVAAEALARRYGLGMEVKLPAVMFAALALSYFTSPTGRFMFRKRDKEDPKTDPEAEQKQDAAK
jgi:uncharacterized membrane protein YoaK (UPF0700 family)